MFHLLPRYIVSCDLGQVADWTAITVLERTPERLSAEGDYELIHLERLPLGLPYTAVPPRLRAITEQTRIRWSTLAAKRNRALPLTSAPISLLVDQTGCGRPVFDYLRAEGLAPIGITIHGGSAVVPVAHDEWHVPKRDLVSSVQMLLQTRRLIWDPVLPGTEVLTAELENFRARISAAGHDSYGAGTAGGDDWRQGDHDDTVLAISMGCWFGELRANGPVTTSTSYLGQEDDDEDAVDRHWA